jgi:hypothetical protein
MACGKLVVENFDFYQLLLVSLNARERERDDIVHCAIQSRFRFSTARSYMMRVL